MSCNTAYVVLHQSDLSDWLKIFLNNQIDYDQIRFKNIDNPQWHAKKVLAVHTPEYSEYSAKTSAKTLIA